MRREIGETSETAYCTTPTVTTKVVTHSAILYLVTAEQLWSKAIAFREHPPTPVRELKQLPLQSHVRPSYDKQVVPAPILSKVVTVHANLVILGPIETIVHWQ